MGKKSNICLGLFVAIVSITVACYLKPPVNLIISLIAYYGDFPLPKYSVEITEIEYELEEGVKTFGYKYSPVDVNDTTPSQYPTLLIRTPYGVSVNEALFGLLTVQDAYYFATQGYHTISVKARGRFGSGGKWRPCYYEKQDGRATLKWLKNQKWFNGKLGTLGASYNGFTQLALLGEDTEIQPQSLIPIVTAKNFVSPLHPIKGGIDANLAIGWNFILSEEDRLKPTGYLGGIWHLITVSAKIVDEGFLWNKSLTVPLKNADIAAFGREINSYRETTLNHAEDEYWMTADTAVELDKANGDNFHFMSAWHDVFVNQTVSMFQEKSLQGYKPYLTIWNGEHGSVALPVNGKFSLEWHDYKLKGGKAPQRPKRIAAQVIPTNKWLYFDEWPPAATTSPYVLYLSSANDGVFSGKLAEDKPSNISDALSFSYDPENPTPTIGGNSLFHAGMFDNLPFLLHRQNFEKDVLIFTSSKKLSENLIVAGEVEVTLLVTSSLENTDFYVKLLDYDAKKNVSINICENLHRVIPGSYVKNGDSSYEVTFKLRPILYEYEKTHQIMIEVASGAHPLWTRNPGSGEDIMEATQFFKSNQKIFAHSSKIVIPVLSK